MPCCQLFAAGSDTYTSYGYCETITPDSGYQMVEGSLCYGFAKGGAPMDKVITNNRFKVPISVQKNSIISNAARADSNHVSR